MQGEHALLSRSFVFGGLRCLHLLGGLKVAALFLRQIAQQLADGDIGGPPHGCLVKTLRLDLHHRRLLARGFQFERAHSPYGLALHEPTHVLAANERHVLAKPRFVKLQQPMPVAIFLAPELAEFLGLLGKTIAQALGKLVKNAGVLLLQRHRQGENFLLVKTMK